MVLDPQFSVNQTIYLAFAGGSAKANTTTVIRAKLNTSGLEDVTTIFANKESKNTSVHYGGKLLFLPDGTLLLTTGDGFSFREEAQNKFSHFGKTIRINPDGSVPQDNPFADGKHGDAKVYSYGHRSPQGLTLDAENNIIYLHEHGPKGGDEVNVIVAGANYGWPAATYGINYSGAQISPYTELPGVIPPIKYWTPSIAPSGLAHYNADLFPQWKNSLFVGALVNQEVRRLKIENQKVVAEEALFSELGARIREIRVGPEGAIYLLTDSKDGKLIKVLPR